MIKVIHYTDTNSVEVTWLDDDGKQTRCHSYADVQMDMLEADLGVDAAYHVDLIATVRANIQPAPAAPPAPIAPISPRQIRQALTRAGLRTAVEAAVAAGDQDLKDWYEFSTSFERNNAQVIAMGEALSVSPASLDDLWALGATL